VYDRNAERLQSTQVLRKITRLYPRDEFHVNNVPCYSLFPIPLFPYSYFRIPTFP
jgi:hypothetical protein